jgi:hypothetical protein
MRAFERGCDNGLVSPQHVSLPGNERIKMAYIYWRFWCAQDPDFERLMCSIAWPKDAPSVQVAYDDFGVYKSLRNRDCSSMKYVRDTEDDPPRRELGRYMSERDRHQFLNRLLLPISDKFGEPPQSAPSPKERPRVRLHVDGRTEVIPNPSVENRVAVYRATRKQIHRARAAELGIAL